MARATVELDFFAMDEENSSSFKPNFPRQRSFRDIQGAISRINPELLKSVITHGSATNKTGDDGINHVNSNSSFSVPSTPKQERAPFPTTMPLYSPLPMRPANLENHHETAPLTIFYNGTVAVFEIPRDKAESILKLAGKGTAKSVVESTADARTDQQQLLETLGEDLPLARRKSLKRFLEKRKERLTSVSPFACASNARL